MTRRVSRQVVQVLVGVVLVAIAVAAGIGMAAPRANATGDEAPATAKGTIEVSILAGGCFWGMEELLRDLDGVVDTEVGYAGGTTPGATYDAVKTGATGHAEAVRVVFEPARQSYADLLRFFFRIHDPTTSGRQGNDIGSQYRSAILVLNDDQRRVAEVVRAEVDASGFWQGPIGTERTDAGPLVPAEDYHQDYLARKPGGYTCHWIRPEK